MSDDRIAKLENDLKGARVVLAALVKQAVEAGMRKVNLSTALQRAFMDTLRQSAAEPGHESDARAVLADARDAVIAAARRRIQIIGAAGRA